MNQVHSPLGMRIRNGGLGWWGVSGVEGCLEGTWVEGQGPREFSTPFKVGLGFVIWNLCQINMQGVQVKTVFSVLPLGHTIVVNIGVLCRPKCYVEVTSTWPGWSSKLRTYAHPSRFQPQLEWRI